MVFTKKLLTVLFLLFAVLLSAQNTSDLAKADKYFELCDFDRAKGLYDEYLSMNPNDPHVLWKLGDISWISYDYEMAYTYYGIASGMDWKSDEHIRRYVEILMKNGDYENALKWAMNLKVRNEEMGAYLVRKVKFSKEHFDDAASYKVSYHDLNSDHSDFGATFIAKDYMVYASARSDMKRVFQKKGAEDWAGRSLNQLFVAPSLSKTDLDQPLFYRTDIENNYNEGPIGVSGDGKWVAVTKNNFLDGINQVYTPGVEMSLYLGILDDKGNWKDLKPYEYNVQGFSTGMACLSEDGSTMYFSSNRPDGFGGFDLYVSHKVDGKWSFPENMGPAINTVGNEITPYVSEKDLYFSSDLQPGYGGFDIYRCELDENNSTSKVYHLGNAVNSKYDDNYFVFDNVEQNGFLTSNRRLEGNEDIYTVVGLGKRVVIRVIDARNGVGIAGANINFGDCSFNELTTDDDGETSLRTINDVNCKLTIGKLGYGLVEIPFDTKSREYFEIALHPKEQKNITTGKVRRIDGRGLDKVYIKVTKQFSEEFDEYVSDNSGEFELALEPNQPYKISLMKSGYYPHEIKITTDDRLISSLPIIEMMEEKKETATSNVIPETLSGLGGKKGFAVQLGAFSDIDKLDLNNYSDLSDLGTLYTRVEGETLKLRLGVYDSEETAKNIKKMMELRGYDQTFLVKESGEQESGVMTTIKEEDSAKMVGNAFELPYAVRLGAFSETKWFNKDQAEKLGQLYSYTKEDLTIFQIVNVSDLKSAKKVVSKAEEMGFKGAYIMVLGTDNEYTKL